MNQRQKEEKARQLYERNKLIDIDGMHHHALSLLAKQQDRLYLMMNKTADARFFNSGVGPI